VTSNRATASSYLAPPLPPPSQQPYCLGLPLGSYCAASRRIQVALPNERSNPRRRGPVTGIRHCGVWITGTFDYCSMKFSVCCPDGVSVTPQLSASNYHSGSGDRFEILPCTSFKFTLGWNINIAPIQRNDLSTGSMSSHLIKPQTQTPVSLTESTTAKFLLVLHITQHLTEIPPSIFVDPIGGFRPAHRIPHHAPRAPVAHPP
jgi:hypothetical protein